MSTPKHTPGPWHVGLRPGPMVYGPQGEQIVGINVMLDRDEVLANMKFIAAAPAMYEALQKISDLYRKAYESDGEFFLDESEIGSLADAALAQAEAEGVL